MEREKAHVEKISRERVEIQKEILETGKQRSAYITGEIKKRNLTQDSAFDEAVRRTVRMQAEKKGFTFEEK